MSSAASCKSQGRFASTTQLTGLKSERVTNLTYKSEAVTALKHKSEMITHLKHKSLLTPVWQRKFDFSVQASRPQQCRVKGVSPVGGHDDLHIHCLVKAVHLVQQLHQNALHFPAQLPEIQHMGQLANMNLAGTWL